MNSKTEKRIKRRKRIRSRISGTSSKPRLSVFRSNRQILLQFIDDEKGITIVGLSSLSAKQKSNIEGAKKLANIASKLAITKGINSVVFDRSGYKYHGVVKAIAETIREAGIKI